MIMVTSKNQGAKYLTSLLGKDILVDTTPDKGGTGQGIRPHELLEAAIASCMNITLRMAMEKYNLPYNSVEVEVKLNRQDPEKAKFEYTYRTDNNLTEEQKEKLRKALEKCPVKKTLSKELEFNFFAGK